MRTTKQIWKGRKLKVCVAKPDDQAARLKEAVACRAYEIYESRGRRPGRELEDWRTAESEIVKPLSCGFLDCDEKISVVTDASFFQPGEIDICIESRRLVICGKERARTKELTDDQPTSRSAIVFRVLDLPEEIDPSRAKARFNGPDIEIDLPNARSSHFLLRQAQADHGPIAMPRAAGSSR